jgi:hypothetical protein
MMGRILGDYPPPRQNVVLLSCMDLRLIDELAAFMDRDNLTNRYDHFVLAGAALGVHQDRFPSWRPTFFDHLRIALELHAPEDVYIIEHRNCGAYRTFLGLDFDDTPEDRRRERDVHADNAFQLKREIAEWCTQQPPVGGKPVRLTVRCFLMDLRGDLELLEEPEAPRGRARRPRSRAAKK